MAEVKPDEDAVAAATPVPFVARYVTEAGYKAAPGEKVVHFIRHGEGQHNVAFNTTGDKEQYKNWDWLDSRLTPKGEEQARTLVPVMAAELVDVVIVSTLSRAIKTGLLACPDAKSFVATELVRERIGMHPCDKRRSKTELSAEFAEVDFAELGEEEDPLWSPAREPWPELVERAHKFMELVLSRPEDHLVCVAHNDFFQALFRDAGWQADATVRGILFKNCDKHTLAISRAPTSETA